ncbi:MAG: GtrA family protein [Chitinophagaceae bacterium]|nr:MAG: GtrA family protein [Chitinophagaceae bacterium]
MKKHFYKLRDAILPVIDFFYLPLIRKIMPIRTFRYAFAGASNTVIGILIYYLCYLFVFKGVNFDFGFYAFKAHNASLFISFCFSFVIGFILMKFVVFDDSNIKGRVQLFRYFLVNVFNLFLDYILLNAAIIYLHFDVLIAKILSTSMVIVFAYLAQNHFTFRKKANPSYLEEDSEKE